MKRSLGRKYLELDQEMLWRRTISVDSKSSVKIKITLEAPLRAFDGMAKRTTIGDYD